MEEEVKVEEGDRTLQKIEDMMVYAFPQMDKFPRTERGYAGMTTIIRTAMMKMSEHCLDTKKCYYAKSVLKELNELDKEIAHCKFYVKLAYKNGLFPAKTFGIVSDYLAQIGKMTGSWINTIVEAEKKNNYGKK